MRCAQARPGKAADRRRFQAPTLNQGWPPELLIYLLVQRVEVGEALGGPGRRPRPARRGGAVAKEGLTLAKDATKGLYRLQKTQTDLRFRFTDDAEAGGTTPAAKMPSTQSLEKRVGD